MGKPWEITIIVGDYSDRGLKRTEPTITKKIRYLFKKRGYRTLLIDEYKTSCICSNCERKMEQLKNKKKESIWKLLKCQFCGAIHNRDYNATKNMYKIVEEIKKRKRRPKWASRIEKNNSCLSANKKNMKRINEGE
jgi:hypothetical protein